MKREMICFGLGIGFCVLAAPGSRELVPGTAQLTPICPQCCGEPEPTVVAAYVHDDTIQSFDPPFPNNTYPHFRVWSDGLIERALFTHAPTPVVVEDWTVISP